MVADLDMIKQITVKDFDSFVNRLVSLLLIFILRLLVTPPPPLSLSLSLSLSPQIPLPIVKEPYGLAKGLLITTDDHWRAARRTLSPTFSSSKMKMVGSVFHDVQKLP